MASDLLSHLAEAAWEPSWQGGSWFATTAKNLVKTVVSVLVMRPLARLYLEGPILFGFWGGADASTICSRLTNVGADFWETNQERCCATIQRHFSSWVILAGTTIYFVILGMGTWAVLRSRCWRRGATSPLPPQIIVVPMDQFQTNYDQHHHKPKPHSNLRYSNIKS